MKILKIVFYILAIPVFLYLALFFEYLSFLSLILIISVFLFRDLKFLNLWWFLLIVSIFLDISLHFWLGTHLLAMTFVLLLLLLFDRFVSNIFLDIIAVFFTFILFRLFFMTFISFQEVSMLPTFDLEILLHSFTFALKNIFAYLILKFGEYILKSYFRGNAF